MLFNPIWADEPPRKQRRKTTKKAKARKKPLIFSGRDRRGRFTKGSCTASIAGQKRRRR